MSAFTLYLLSVAINLGDVSYIFAIVTGIVCVLIFIFLFVVSVDSDFQDRKGETLCSRLGKFFQYAAIIFVVSISLKCLIPSKPMIAAMCIVPYVTNIEGIANVPPEIVKATSKLLKEYLEDGEKK